MSILSGFLFVDKPLGITSAKVVSIIKSQLKSYNIKVGHCGTLDPMATGLLPIALGEATKITNYFLNDYKCYLFSIQFGKQTDTGDLEGKVVNSNTYLPTKKDILNVLPNFIGKNVQEPPKLSAIKISGKRAYKLARSNIEFVLPKRTIEIIKLKLVEYNTEKRVASFNTIVSKGTYIRSLANDLLNNLNSLGYVSVLHRIQIGKIKLTDKEKAFINNDLLYNVSSCLKTHLVALEDMLDDILAITLSATEYKRLITGKVIINRDNLMLNQTYKAIYQDKVVALLFNNVDCLKIIRVFNDHTNIITI